MISRDPQRRAVGYSTYVLIFGQKRQVKDNSEWASIRGHDHKFTSTPVERLGALVGALRRQLAYIFKKKKKKQWKCTQTFFSWR